MQRKQPKTPKLSDHDLLKLTHLLVLESDSYLEESIRHDRAKALRYFKGENPDNMPMPDGRSRMVDTQLRDTILWVMPDLTRIFAGDDEVTSIEPHGDEDDFDAEMAEEWVNWVIMRQNRGFLTTYNWIMDALLSKLGFLKQSWKENVTRKRRDFEGLDQREYDLLKKAEDFEVTDERERVVVQISTPTGAGWVDEDDLQPGMQPVMDETGDIVTMAAYDVTGYQVFSEWRIREDTVPPEEVGFLADTVEIPWKCSFIYHESEKTLGELREMFPDEDIPDDISGFNITSTGLYDEESIERFYDTSKVVGLDDDGGQTGSIDPSRRKVWLYEIYVKADRDGDGIPEWLQIFRVGDTILSIDEVDYPKIFTLCPIIWPHRAVGMSLADLLFDLQDLQTALNRQVLDHIYQANNPRTEIDMSGANEDTLDDYLDNRIGGYVRVDRPGTVRPLEYSPLEPWTFNLLEHWEQKRESRTGVSRLNGGLDPNSLNKTATGVVEILNQAARRIEQIARIFAETGFRDRVRGILDLSAEFPDYVKGQIMRLSGETREINPDAISGRYDLIVNAGIGTGNKAQQAQHMMMLLQIHQQMIAAGMGPGAGEKQMVTLKNLYNTVRDMIVLWGHRNTADYITDPDDKNADRDPPAQPQPTKDQLDHQAEMEKIKLDREKQQAQHQKDMADLALKREELELKRQELKLKEYEAGMKMADNKTARAVDERKAANEARLKERELSIKEKESEEAENDEQMLGRIEDLMKKLGES